MPVELAWRAHARGDWPEALRQWEIHRHEHPDDFVGYSAASVAARELERFDAADALLEDGLRRAPGNPELLANMAWNAQRRPDWPEALRRWRDYQERFPGDRVGYTGVATSLRALARFDEAEQIMERAVVQFPCNEEVLANHAWVAQEKGELEIALKRWEAYRARFPAHRAGLASIGFVLRALGRFDEAEQVLNRGLEHYPDDWELLSSHAWAATDRQDWHAALARWNALHARRPGDATVRYQIAQALGELGRFAEANAFADSSPLRTAELGSPRDLMLGFESLGDNCEFGMVQSHFGAEPLGLLRFSATHFRSLSEALRRRLEGVGEPENTTIEIIKAEYFTRDTRFGMAMHTFVRASDDNREKRIDNFHRRLRYLREKLLGDLTTGEKIFVYSCRDAMTDDDKRDLWRALGLYGSNRLFVVTVADEHDLPGTVRSLEPGLAVGFVDRLTTEDPSFACWLRLCQGGSRILSSRAA